LVGGAKYYKVPRQVKLAEREDVVWQAGKAWRWTMAILQIWRHILREDPLALRTTPFQEGEDDEDIGTPGWPTICDN
jgi:hypothetical protein